MRDTSRFTKRRTAVVLATTLALGGFGAAPFLGAQRPDVDGFSQERLRRIGEFAERRIAARSFSGAVTLVARQGRVVHLEAHGLADLESKRPMRTDTIFRIMSMTKPVVAVSILMLVEAGKVDLSAPASRFIPALKGLQVASPQGGSSATPSAARPRGEPVAAQREITVRDLLTHTSGLVRALPFGTPEALGGYVERLASVSLDFQPGTRWTYSPQAGFDILARIVEIASGQTFDAFTRERIFGPLGMKDTFFDPAHGVPRMVTLGMRLEDRVEVTSGLAEGEEVVSSGVFLIDSESRLRASGGAGTGHVHGAAGGTPPAGTPAEPPAPKAPPPGHEHAAPPRPTPKQARAVPSEPQSAPPSAPPAAPPPNVDHGAHTGH